MPAQAMSIMWPPNSFRHYPLSLQVLQERCFIGQRWVPYKKRCSAPYLTDKEMKMLFAVVSPRVSHNPLEYSQHLHGFLERDLASILASPTCWLCLSFPIQARREGTAWLRLGRLHHRSSRDPGVPDLSHPCTLRPKQWTRRPTKAVLQRHLMVTWL